MTTIQIILVVAAVAIIGYLAIGAYGIDRTEGDY